MPIQKGDAFLPYPANHNLGAGFSERRIDIVKFCTGQLLRQRIAQARTANYPNQFLCHISGLLCLWWPL
jgi:hypothetical protein